VTQPTAFAVTMLSWGLAQFSSGYKSAGETNNALEQVQVGSFFRLLLPLIPLPRQHGCVQVLPRYHGLASIVALLCISVADSTFIVCLGMGQASLGVAESENLALWRNCR